MHGLEEQLEALQRENSKLKREISRMERSAAQKNAAYASVLNQEKARTFIQQERGRYLMLFLANSPNIIIFLGKTGRIEFCTNYFAAKAGYNNVEDILGHRIFDVLSPFMEKEAREILSSRLKESNQSNISLSFDISFCFGSVLKPHSGDGTESGLQDRSFDASHDFGGLIVPMVDDEISDAGGTMLLFHDITDLRRSREEALSANRAKSAFLSNMSHEIRTPLNAIMGMTDIGKNSSSISNKNDAFTKIQTASAFLLGIINDVLDISKIESGKLELMPVNFDFHLLMDKVISVISVHMQKKNQIFTVELDPQIPHHLNGDDHCIAQVLTNILSNATKFAPEHSEITLIAENLHKDDNHCILQFKIKDKGIGMSQEEQAKIFNIFQQAEVGISRKFGGSGLGLTISQRLLELMGGEIKVKSEKGKGAEFFFSVKLPIAKNYVQTQASRTAKIHDYTGKTVLVVDDVEINIEIASAMLEAENINVLTASSGEEAIALFEKNHAVCDMILMDMQMPGIDGLQATQMLRALKIKKAATIPIIAMTANVFKEDIDRCIRVGMNGHLGKPVNKDEFMRVLEIYLGR